MLGGSCTRGAEWASHCGPGADAVDVLGQVVCGADGGCSRVFMLRGGRLTRSSPGGADGAADGERAGSIATERTWAGDDEARGESQQARGDPP